MVSKFAITAYLKYRLKARHQKGYGIHSPFVFALLNGVFYEKTPFYCYEEIEEERKTLRQNTQTIQIIDFGSGCYKQRKIGDIVRQSVKRTKYAQLLFRLANSNKSQTIVELGTCVGISTLYLSAVNRAGKVITIDGDQNSCNIARELFKKHGAGNITSICAQIDDVLPTTLQNIDQLDFVFFDANHKGEATLKYFNLCRTKLHKNSILVFDDIHRSIDMQNAWNKIKSLPEVHLAIDIYEMGILFFNTDLIKQEYTVAY